MKRLGLLAVGLLLIAACGHGFSHRLTVTVVGIDGASWRVIDPLLARGELPHIASLIATGVRAPLRSQRPLSSPAVWTTIATGVSRQRHGIKGFRNPDGGLVRSSDRKTPALWTAASQAGLSSVVIGWWATYPAEVIKGVIVSERALKIRDDEIREMLGGGLADAHARALTYPPRVIEMVDDLVGNAPRVDVDLDYDAYRATVPPRMRREDAAVIHSLLRLRESLGPFDLELALLRGVDPVSHFFWKFYDPGASFYAKRGRPTPEEVRQHGSTVEDHYRYVDSLLGELRASGTRDHVVVLLSDHGFEAGRQKFRRGGTLSGTHASPAALDGIFVAAGGPFRRGVELERASILDVAPTLLHLLGVPVSQEIEGRVLLDALEPSYRAAHPVRTVPRYDPAPPPAAVEEDTRAEDALREELRALGYIE